MSWLVVETLLQRFLRLGASHGHGGGHRLLLSSLAYNVRHQGDKEQEATEEQEVDEKEEAVEWPHSHANLSGELFIDHGTLCITLNRLIVAVIIITRPYLLEPYQRQDYLAHISEASAKKV